MPSQERERTGVVIYSSFASKKWDQGGNNRKHSERV
jgi:hypothetical protein